MMFHNIQWPDTGRLVPDGAKTEVHNIHEKWLDLVWWCEKQQVWVYTSTVQK
jgi:hypothetical protein